MTTTVVFSGTNDGNIQSGNTATYALARSGGATFVVNTVATSTTSGQEVFSSKYYCYNAFFDFDTSAIPDTDAVSAAVLSLWGLSQQVSGSSAFTHNARLNDWGATLTSADWTPGASLTGLTLLAHLAQTSVTQAAYNAFVNDAFPANVNKTGNTRIVVASTREEAGTVPGGSASTEYQNWSTADTAGTTSDPKLTITHAAPVAGPSDHFGTSGMFGV